MKHDRLPALLLFVLLCLASGVALAQDVTPEPTVEPTPLYAERGPYSVGRTWFSDSHGTDEPLILVAWYPAQKQDGNQEVSTLTVPDEYNVPNENRVEDINWGSAVLNAMPEDSTAPYPLVIFSPGYNSTPNEYTNIEEHLASYGFIVVSALHPDSSLWSGFITRPLLLPHEIDLVEKINNQDGSFKGLIDMKHIGVVGHSLGGYTALAAAGAQFNLAGFETYCADHPDSVSAHFDCPALLGHKEEMLALAKLDSIPTALWPSWSDSRVTAIVSQSTPAYVFGSAGLSPVTIPVMIQFGSNDQLVTPDWAGYNTYASVSSTEKAQVVFENGNHVMFNQGGGDVEPDGWDMNRAHDLINHFTTAFLLDKLKGDSEAHKALLPEAVSFSGIAYTTTMQ